MKLKTNVPAAMAVACALFSAQAQASAPEDVIRDSLGEAVPNASIESIEASEAPGFYRVQLGGGESIHIDGQGEHLFTGDLLKISDDGLVNVTEQRKAGERRTTMDAYEGGEPITYAATNQQRAVIDVFTDIDCPYCRKLHDEIDTMNDMGITVNYYAFPRSGPNTPSWEKHESTWCSNNPDDAMNAALAGQSIPQKSCHNPVNEHYRLGKRIGVTGTPAIVIENGEIIPGYVPADRLAGELGLN